MDKMAIITPICLQTEAMLNIYLSNIATYNPIVDTKIYVIFNRKNVTNSYLKKRFASINSKLKFEFISDFERSVAGSWNKGIMTAMDDNRYIYYILAADVALHPNAMRNLYDNITTRNYNIISSRDFLESYGKIGIGTDGSKADFSSVMLTNKTIEKFGWFDKEYKPAYYEDNDYAIRIRLMQESMYYSFDAIHYHYLSATIKTDAEMAHHVKSWFDVNKNRFISKWGALPDQDISQYFTTPYNSGRDITWWPEKDNIGYDVAGQIH